METPLVTLDPKPTPPLTGSSTFETMPSLRVGLVGAGKMAMNHARAVARAGGRGSVVAVADPSEAARQGLLASVPGAVGFDSLGEMLARAAVDVVHVCTPGDPPGPRCGGTDGGHARLRREAVRRKLR